MNAEIKARWLAALRSGEYEQGTGNLNKDGKFCCLGVLCDLYVKDGHAQWEAEPGRDGLIMWIGRHAALPPYEVQQWAGIDANPIIPVPGDEYPSGLASLNDAGKSFAEIADLIEAHL